VVINHDYFETTLVDGRGLQVSQVSAKSYGEKRKSSQIGEIFSLLRTLIVFLAIAFMLRASVVEAFKIPSSSMEPTLMIGDHILVFKLQYGFRLPLLKETLWLYGEPSRGDIVVFTLPDDPATPEVDEADTNIIKRVVGLPGDLIEVRGTKVYINQREYPDETAVWYDGGIRDFGPVLVPEGKILLLGDNRDRSRDSRFWPEAFLDVNRIKGKAFIIYWSSRFNFSRLFRLLG